MSVNTPVKMSATAAMHKQVLARQASGLPVYDLSMGEPALPTHPLIKAQVNKQLETDLITYPPIAGFAELRQQAAAWMNASYQSQYQADNCLVVNGAKFGLYLLLKYLIKANDEVIIPAPYWVSYADMTTLHHGKPVIINTKQQDDWKLQAQALQACITPNTKILLLNNPCNPTGALYTKAELAALLKVAAAHKLLVIADEVYSELVYDEHQFTSCSAFPEYREQLIVIQSCSKNFAMTGWRVGFVFAEANIIQELIPLISQTTSGVPVITQWAAQAALKNSAEISAWVRMQMQANRDALQEQLQTFVSDIKVPIAGLYYFMPLSALTDMTDSAEFCLSLLDEKGIAMVPGSAFGYEGCVRLSFGRGWTGTKCAMLRYS